MKVPSRIWIMNGFVNLDASKSATPKKEHKVLLSYESEDAIMRVPVDWEYARFLKEVANVFPNLKKVWLNSFFFNFETGTFTTGVPISFMTEVPII